MSIYDTTHAFRERILELLRDKDHELKSLSALELARIAASIIPKQSKIELEDKKPISILINHNYNKHITSIETDTNENGGTGGTGMPESGGGSNEIQLPIPKNAKMTDRESIENIEPGTKKHGDIQGD